MDIESVWKEYRSRLKAFLHSKVNNPDDVDDLLQEILLKAYLNIGGIESQESLKSWLFQVAHNAAMDFYRKRARSPEPESEKLQFAELQSEEPWLEELWFEESASQDIRMSLAECLEPFIQALPEESSELLADIDLRGKSQKECAEEQGIPYTTLKSRVKKGREQLKALYEACCHMTTDRHGRIVDCERKEGSERNC